MTKIKKAKSVVIEGGKSVIQMSEYYEVGGAEVDKMLEKVAEGGNEEKLKEELIKKSAW